MQRRARRTRQIQQIVDHLRHRGHRRAKLNQHRRFIRRLFPRLRLPQKIADVDDGLQRTAQIVGHGVRKGLQLTVGGLQFCGALFHPAFQIGLRLFQHCVALLDLGKHLVEGFSQRGQLAVAPFGVKTQRIVAVTRDQARRLCKGNDRPGENAAENPARHQRNHQAECKDAAGDSRVAQRLLAQIPQVRLHVNGADRLAVKINARTDENVGAAGPLRFIPIRRQRAPFGDQRPVGRIHRKRRVAVGVDRRRYHIVRIGKGGQSRVGRHSVVEKNCGDAVRPDDLRFCREVPNRRFPEGEQIVGEERDIDQDQRDAADQGVHQRERSGDRSPAR
jgi:hypothetical protein